MRIDYTDLSKIYDDYRSYPEHVMRKTVEFSGIRRGMRVLDIGCGTGNAALRFRESMGVDVKGVDVSLQMLERAKSKSLHVVCADVDGTGMPFRDACFDIVLGVYVLHQIKNFEALFSECHRIVGRGAAVFLTSSHRQIEHQHPVIQRFFPSFVEIEKARFPDIPKLDALLAAAGFADIKHEDVAVEGIPVDETFLQKVKNKYISTYCLIPRREYELGVEKLEEFVKNRDRPEFREWRGTLISGSKDG
jgi:ubiquinone/menaquinone biosynthesis C-methylase UbiE